MTYALYDHQRTASILMDNLDAIALFYEQGTGKTMCVLDWVERHCEEGELPPGSVLIVCPASVVPMWVRAIANLSRFGIPQDMIENVRRAVVITSFGKLYQSERTGGRTIHTLRQEYKHAWALAAIDESHSIGAHDSVRTRMCLELALYAQKRVILTGTPISGGGGKGDYAKLYGQMLFLDYGQFDGMRGKKIPYCTWSQWRARYITSEDYFGKPLEYDEPSLNKIMKRYALVARLDQCYDMPSYTETDIPIQMEGRAQQYYRSLDRFDPVLDDDHTVELSTGGSRYIKMYEITSGFVKCDEDTMLTFPTPRRDALDTIIRGTDDKVVVFCHFKHSVKAAFSICMMYGPTVIMDGDSKQDEWTRFQDGDARYIVCQYQSGGVGIDLYASHTCVFYEPTMSSLLLDQAKARIRRRGQEKHCLYYHIVTDGIDRRISDTVRSGVDVTNGMLDEWDKEERAR